LSRKINLTNQQAKKGIKLCVKNASSFVEDAELCISIGRFNHLIIPIEFALEEIGKGQIIREKLEKNSIANTIILDENDGIFDHKKKLKFAVFRLEHPERIKGALSFLEGESREDDYVYVPRIANKLDALTSNMRERSIEGHDLRISTSFVDFNPTSNEPVLKQVREGDINHTLILPSLKKSIRELNDYTNTN
jgi:AbiV family abortive infection protein